MSDGIVWPHEEENIMTTLNLRPIPHTRNWYPDNHPVALRAGIPHGQSVLDLIQENSDHGVI
jgi:hypothetical protein